MNMADKIPQFKTEQEEADFWDSHDSTDFIDETEAVDVTFVDARPVEEVIALVKEYLHQLRQQGIPVQYGVLFGSWAKAQPHEWSDIDLLVVSSRFDEERRREDVNLLWRTAAHTDNRIEPIPVGKLQYEDDDSSPIIEMARREGVVVTI